MQNAMVYVIQLRPDGGAPRSCPALYSQAQKRSFSDFPSPDEVTRVRSGAGVAGLGRMGFYTSPGHKIPPARFRTVRERALSRSEDEKISSFLSQISRIGNCLKSSGVSGGTHIASGTVSERARAARLAWLRFSRAVRSTGYLPVAGFGVLSP